VACSDKLLYSEIKASQIGVILQNSYLFFVISLGFLQMPDHKIIIIYTGISKIILINMINHFLNVKICQTVLFFIFSPHFAVMPKDFYACLTNCVGVFRETGSVTHKKVLFKNKKKFLGIHWTAILF
jgi:hypothetical protein